MRLKIKPIELFAGRPVSILNVNTAHKLNVHVDERVSVSKGFNHEKKKIISVVDTASKLIGQNEIAVSKEILEALDTRSGAYVDVRLAQEPISTHMIRKKLDNKRLSQKEIKKIIEDIVTNALTETEIAYFISAVYKCGMSQKEIGFLIGAMVDVGKKIKFKGKVVDKHSIGGVAGNRTTPLVVAICSAAGLKVPKTSSRAITSSAGTADVLEAISNVEFSISQIKKIVEKTNACMVWGGSLGLSPADDKLIQIERILHLDPKPQLLASVLSKKISVGSKYVIIDIPYGKGAKVAKSEALKLKKQFEKFGKKFNLKLKAVLTDGSQPIGNGVGPFLEIQDIMAILERRTERPKDLEKKAVFLAGELLELSGKTKEGEKLALSILNSGKALEKFKQIIKAQGGAIPKKFPKTKYTYTIKAKRAGKIKYIDNKKINTMGSLAGSPADNSAGLYLHLHVKEKVKKDTSLITIHTQSKTRLKDVKSFYKRSEPIKY